MTITFPKDALGELSTFCTIPFDASDLQRFAAIAEEDLKKVFEARPELKDHRIVTVLAEDAGEHYVNKTGFKCISLWTFFAKVKGIRAFHPMRHTRIDFGSDKFGHSSWVKHPGDIGFKGRGVNNFGRTIELVEGETIAETMTRYLTTAKTDGAARLRNKAMVVVWPKENYGEVIAVDDKKRECNPTEDSPSKKARKVRP